MDKHKGRSLLIIHNPKAGKPASHEALNDLRGRLEAEGLFYKEIKTEYVNHARELAREYASVYDVIIAAGGDGTVNEVASGLMDLKKSSESSSGKCAALSVYPIGTGNDFYRSFGGLKNLKDELERMVEGRGRMIDICECHASKPAMGDEHNTKASSEPIYAFNIASIGLDCLTVKMAKKFKKHLPGGLSYVAGLIYSVFAFKRDNLRIETDDKELDISNILLCFGKGGYYGGGIGIMPWDKPMDGRMEILNIRDMAKAILPILTPTIAFNKHTSFKKYVHTYRSRRLIIKGKGFDFNVDGEIYSDIDFIEVTCIKGALEVII